MNCKLKAQEININNGDNVILKEDNNVYIINNCEENIMSEDGSYWKEYIITLIGKKKNNKRIVSWEWTDEYKDIPIILLQKGTLLYYLYFIKDEGYKLYGSGDMAYIMELLNDYLYVCKMYGEPSVEFLVTTDYIN